MDGSGTVSNTNVKNNNKNKKPKKNKHGYFKDILTSQIQDQSIEHRVAYAMRPGCHVDGLFVEPVWLRHNGKQIYG
ncbi:MAG: hypothetical protein PVJ25_06465 [Desulfuromonadales bacterium]